MRHYPRFELKAVQYYAGQSRGTFCYSADLFFDGVKVGAVGNSGQGGATSFRKESGADTSPMFVHIATLPDRHMELGGHQFTCETDLELVADTLLSEWLTEEGAAA